MISCAHKSPLVRRGAWLLALSFLSATATADQVTFKNGDRLSGTVKSMADGKIVFASNVAGDVSIAMSEIQELDMEGTVALHFTDGRVVENASLAAQGGVFTFDEQSLNIEELDAINPPPLVKWSGNVSASAVFNRGNTQKTTAAVNAAVTYRSDPHRLLLDASYAAGRERDNATGEDSTSERRVAGGAKYDYFFTERLYGWGLGAAEKDAIAEIDLRTAYGAGGGYQWIDEADHKFSTDLGLTYIDEKFRDDTPDDDKLSARFGYNYSLNITEGVAFSNITNWFPSLEESDDHLVSSEVLLTTSLTESMYAEFRFEFDWDSTPADDAERTDVLYGVGIGWAF